MHTAIEHLYSRARHNKTTGCMLWQRAINSEGYAVRRLNRLTQFVHRLTYAREHSIDYDRVPRLENTCGWRHCINPQHWRGFVRKKKPAKRRAPKVRPTLQF
jgi:hypothetical protein